MKKRMMMIAACLMAGSITFSSLGLVSKAQTIQVPLAGLQASISGSQDSEQGSADKQDGTDGSSEAQAQVSNPYDNLAIAQINDDAYVNIRNKPNTDDGEVLGKLYDNSAAEILGEEDGWYHIRSGSVEGYVKKEYFVTGAEAEALAEQVGKKVATVKTTTLMVRSGAGTDQDIVGMVGDSEKLRVLDDQGDWVKVRVDSDMEGYVSKEYVDCSMHFKVAESLEEERQRLAAEEAAYQAALEEARKADEAASNTQGSSQGQNNASTDAQQTETPETGAPETNVPETETPAVNAPETNAPETNAPETEAPWTEAPETEAPQTETTWTETPETNAPETNVPETNAPETEAPATEVPETETNAPETEAPATETPATEPPQTEAPGNQDPSGGSGQGSSTSGTRQSIVSFALQFEGNPYVWGGTSLTNGADCSGFTQSIMANFGISIPRVAADQAYGGRSVDVGSVQPGDLLFYLDDSGSIGHVALYIGNNQVIHASTPETGIIISDISYRQAYSAASYID